MHMKQTQAGSRFVNFIKETEIGSDLMPLEGAPKINGVEVVVLQVAVVYIDMENDPTATYMCAEVVDPLKIKEG